MTTAWTDGDSGIAQTQVQGRQRPDIQACDGAGVPGRLHVPDRPAPAAEHDAAPRPGRQPVRRQASQLHAGECATSKGSAGVSTHQALQAGPRGPVTPECRPKHRPTDGLAGADDQCCRPSLVWVEALKLDSGSSSNRQQTLLLHRPDGRHDVDDRQTRRRRHPLTCNAGCFQRRNDIIE